MTIPDVSILIFPVGCFPFRVKRKMLLQSGSERTIISVAKHPN